MKKIITVLLSAMMLVSLSACGDTDTSSKTTSKITSEMNGNIPEGNTDGEYTTSSKTDSDKTDSDSTLKDKADDVKSGVKEFVDSEKNMINSIVG